VITDEASLADLPALVREAARPDTTCVKALIRPTERLEESPNGHGVPSPAGS
jgi:hypothetical protein